MMLTHWISGFMLHLLDELFRRVEHFQSHFVLEALHQCFEDKSW